MFYTKSYDGFCRVPAIIIQLYKGRTRHFRRSHRFNHTGTVFVFGIAALAIQYPEINLAGLLSVLSFRPEQV